MKSLSFCIPEAWKRFPPFRAKLLPTFVRIPSHTLQPGTQGERTYEGSAKHTWGNGGPHGEKSGNSQQTPRRTRWRARGTSRRERMTKRLGTHENWEHREHYGNSKIMSWNQNERKKFGVNSGFQSVNVIGSVKFLLFRWIQHFERLEKGFSIIFSNVLIERIHSRVQ